ncbi:MAG: hypothetical protein AB7N91_08105 [Candidatus Tectimicrobiota bacterium]
MAPVVALRGAPHGPLLTDGAQALGHANLLGGLRFLALLGFLSRRVLLLAPGGPEVFLDGGQGQQGVFHADREVEDVVGVEVALQQHLAQQARLLLLGPLLWPLQVLIALEGVYIGPHGLAVQAAAALPDLGGFGVKTVAGGLARAAHGAASAADFDRGFRGHNG